MNVLLRNSNGVYEVSAGSKLLSMRKIFVEGEINERLACDFARQVMFLADEDPYRPMDVLINSPGGEINSGLFMYDVIQACRTPIRTFCVGKAYSMGAVLFVCGNSGRYMLPHSELMLHEPALGNSVRGSSSSIQSISESLLRTKRQMNQILALHTKKSEEEIEKATGFDHYFNAEESLAFGLCDEIVGFDKIMEEV